MCWKAIALTKVLLALNYMKVIFNDEADDPGNVGGVPMKHMNVTALKKISTFTDSFMI